VQRRRLPVWMRLRQAWGMLLIVTLWAAGVARAAALPQAPTPEERAARLLQAMTPVERVGQLFLLTLEGPEFTPDSPIADLIANYHIGGVVLSRANDNFLPLPDTLPAAQRLIRDLQTAAWAPSQGEQIDPATGEPFTPAFVPLLIAMEQTGSLVGDQILSGMTPLPGPMAIGATWQPDLAQQAGVVLGRELRLLGVNLLLGPSLDVLETPHPGTPGDLGVQSFGGDPFWVGVLGQAYIRGMHQGADGRLAVIATHFPGLGAADRLPREEVATVRKSLEQLKQIELAPFFAVTGGALDPEAVTDGLLTTHIRYQGFQGNIRATTRPISFDPQALAALMGLDPFTSWRAQGGVLVSDDLGAASVRRFYAPVGTFNSRLIVRDAFLAGNDLLYLGTGIQEDRDPDPYTTIRRVLDFFLQKYREDPAFAQRVDQAVLRILTLKFRLYGTFSLDNTLPKEDDLAQIGQGQETVFEVARNAATLISPSPVDLDTVLPSPPILQDQMVFLTDVYQEALCTDCEPQTLLAVDGMEQAVLHLYGPFAGGEVVPNRLRSYSFEDVLSLLNGDPQGAAVERDLRNADWIVILFRKPDADRPASQALRGLLTTRPDLLRDKKVVAFALDAPYYLDATDISNLTAYYGLFGLSEPFLEVAARLLFRELLPAPGASPVSVPGVGYDLITATSPDPDQIIPLFFDFPAPEATVETPTPQATEVPQFQFGESVPVRTGVILDHNGHPVPDGTVVRFVLSTVDGNTLREAETTTRSGVASLAVPLDVGSGSLLISVYSEPARQSQVLQIDVLGAPGTPTPAPTATPTPAPTLTATVPVQLTPTEEPHEVRVGLVDWGVSVVWALLLAWGAYLLDIRRGWLRWGVRSALAVLTGGWLAYSALIARTEPIVGAWSGRSAVVIVVLVGALGAWGVTQLVRWFNASR